MSNEKGYSRFSTKEWDIYSKLFDEIEPRVHAVLKKKGIEYSIETNTRDCPQITVEWKTNDGVDRLIQIWLEDDERYTFWIAASKDYPADEYSSSLKETLALSRSPLTKYIANIPRLLKLTQIRNDALHRHWKSLSLKKCVSWEQIENNLEELLEKGYEINSSWKVKDLKPAK